MGYKSKAEQMFEVKVQAAIKAGDWPRVEEITQQYEGYLKLIEPICTYQLQFTDEVGEIEVCTVHGNNSRHDPVNNPHRLCLTVDPYPTPDYSSHVEHANEQMRLAAVTHEKSFWVY